MSVWGPPGAHTDPFMTGLWDLEVECWWGRRGDSNWEGRVEVKMYKTALNWFVDTIPLVGTNRLLWLSDLMRWHSMFRLTTISSVLCYSVPILSYSFRLQQCLKMLKLFFSAMYTVSLTYLKILRCALLL